MVRELLRLKGECQGNFRPDSCKLLIYAPSQRDRLPAYACLLVSGVTGIAAFATMAPCLPRRSPCAPVQESPLAVVDRRKAMRLAYANGAVWALGNGLFNSWLILYLALEFRLPQAGLGIGLIVAAPQLAGLLRLGTPSLIGRLWDRKRFCLTAYLLSAMALLAIPWAASPGRLPSPAMSLAALVALWCAYQVLEYLGTVALWSWFNDLAPAAIRGRFLGRRERWMAAGQAVGAVLAGGFLWKWHDRWPQEPQWTGYAVAACAGACAMIAALAPLALIPRVVVSPAARGGVPSPPCWPRWPIDASSGCWRSAAGCRSATARSKRR